MKIIVVLFSVLLSMDTFAFDISSHKDWESSGFKNIKIKKIDLIKDYQRSKHKLKFTSDFVALVIRDKGWKEDGVFRQVTDAAKVMTQCRVWFKNIYYVEVDLPKGIHYLNKTVYGISYSESESKVISEMVPEFDGTFALFLNSSPNGWYGSSMVGASKRNVLMFEHPWWLLLGRHYDAGKSIHELKTSVHQRETVYSNLAHELTHLFTNEGNHFVNLMKKSESEWVSFSFTKTRNILMDDEAKRTNQISWDQCLKIQKQPYFRKQKFE